MSLGQDVLTRLPRALACEWVVSNGVGSSASGTAAGANLRRSHACLLATPPRGPAEIALLRIDERAVNEDGSFELACAVQPNGTARPAGHRLLESFGSDPWPTWRYRLGATVIEKSLMLVYEHDAVIVSYRHVEGPPARITASPLVAVRPRLAPSPASVEEQGKVKASVTPGAARRARGTGSPKAAAAVTVQGLPSATLGDGPSVQGIPGRVRIQMTPETPLLTLWHNGGFLPGRAWTQLRYAAEIDVTESAFLPGCFEGTCGPGAPLHVVAALDHELFRTLAREARLGTVPPRTLAECVLALEADERERLAVWGERACIGALVTVREAARSREGDPGSVTLEPVQWTVSLARALQAGLVRRGARLTLAGVLPATLERGSETLRATLGLLAIRSFDTARDILRGYLEYMNEGRAPERFDPDGTPVYGDAEPGLWLVIAGERYVRRSEDLEFARDTLYPALQELMRACRSGAPGGIRVDADGLLVTLEPARAPLDDPLATPARSKRRRAATATPPVFKRADLNALWYHASIAMSQLARMVGRKEHAAFYLAWAHEHQQRFNESFWDAEHRCLYDALRDGEPVVGLTPSQLWTVSAAPSLLPRDRAIDLVETIDRTLVTPFGLKPNPGAEEVGVEWLATFLSAQVRAHGRSLESIERARDRLASLCAWMDHEGLGGLPEICGVTETDALPQAGRVNVSPLAASALLRVWVEDLEHALAVVPAG